VVRGAVPTLGLVVAAVMKRLVCVVWTGVDVIV
jgi:hypothetical protein